MDQEAWDQIYMDLESDVAAMTKRSGGAVDPELYLAIDRARFAMDKGESDAAIAIIQVLKDQLRGAPADTRGPVPSVPTIDRLDALEERLHAETRLGSARLEVVGEDEEPPTRAASQNAKVNKSIKYEDIRDEYVRLFQTCKIREDKLGAARREADRIVANRKVYQEISGETEVPWWFIGLIHGMECSFSLSKHLHNGDSLKARTWQVPAGRPKEGSPPFTFVNSAVDALGYDGFSGKTDWPLPMVLYRLERYNGFGYRKKFGTASPYLWSYCNHFTSGKYVRDGVYDPDAISKQCGTVAMLRDLLDRGVVSFEAKQSTVVAASPAPVSAAAPTPGAAPVAAVPPPVAPVQPAAAPAPAVPAISVPAAPAVSSPAAPAPAPVAPTPVAGPVPAPVAPDAVKPVAPVPDNMSPAVAAALAELASRTKK